MRKDNCSGKVSGNGNRWSNSSGNDGNGNGSGYSNGYANHGYDNS